MKDVWTWSRLFNKTKRLATHNLEAYKELVGSGLLGMADERHVRVKLDREDMIYRLHWEDEERPFCKIAAAISGGKITSLYRTHLVKSSMRKGMMNLLPIEFPTTFNSGNDSAVNYLNLDNSVSCQGLYTDVVMKRPRRRGPYKFGTRGLYDKAIAIDDQTGQFIEDYPTRSLDKHYEYHQAVDLLCGFLEGTVPTAADWLASMRPPDVTNWDFHVPGSGDVHTTFLPGPLWDEQGMVNVAKKVLGAAKQFMDNAPHVKFALYPAGIRKLYPNSLWDMGLTWKERFEVGSVTTNAERRHIVVGRTDDGCPILWYPPAIVLYWTKQTENSRLPRWIRVTIPPVGCLNLDADSYGSSSYSRITAESIMSPSVIVGVRHKNFVPERAYHGLACKTSRVLEWTGRAREPICKRMNHEFEWSSKSTAVMVEDCHEYGWEHPWREYCSMTPYATAPDRCFDLYEESEILEALPAC